MYVFVQVLTFLVKVLREGLSNTISEQKQSESEGIKSCCSLSLEPVLDKCEGSEAGTMARNSKEASVGGE